MGFQIRKLAYESNPKTLPDPCDDNDCNESCLSICSDSCPQLCHQDSALPTKYLIILSTLFALLILILCSFVYYVRCYKRRRDETTETLAAEVPIVDHPIWYINTVGLQPSVISSIAICKYVKSEGLVDGTECSVCLTEFEEDESLRLLPKCSHAFHVSCIDTWLSAHVNCPMCRAPVVSSESNNEGTRIDIMEDDDVGTEGGSGRTSVDNEGNVVGESSVQGVRRSVSSDSMTASSEIDNGLADGLDKEKESSLRIASSSVQAVRRSVSSIGRSLSMRPIFMKRSFSCNGKFSLPISINNDDENSTPNRNQNTPLRSFSSVDHRGI